jgi:hypothetical protein
MIHIGFEVLTPVVMKVIISWDIAPSVPIGIQVSDERITSIFRVDN